MSKSKRFTNQDLLKLGKRVVVSGSIAGNEVVNGKRPSKYRNEKVEYEGEIFDSKKELERYKELKTFTAMNWIFNLRRQVKYKLEVNGILICAYIADYVYSDGCEDVIEDVKSEFTRTLPVYRLKKKLMKAIYNIEIKEV